MLLGSFPQSEEKPLWSEWSPFSLAIQRRSFSQIQTKQIYKRIKGLSKLTNTHCTGSFACPQQTLIMRRKAYSSLVNNANIIPVIGTWHNMRKLLWKCIRLAHLRSIFILKNLWFHLLLEISGFPAMHCKVHACSPERPAFLLFTANNMLGCTEP